MFKTLIIVDNEELCDDNSVPGTISFERYLRDYPKRNEPKTRIINLCDCEHYLSKGYYCSLLAEARRHRVLPSVKTINELRSHDFGAEPLELLPPDDADKTPLQAQEHLVYFGKTTQPKLAAAALKAFQKYTAPILRLLLIPENGQYRLALQPESYTNLTAAQRSDFLQALDQFTQTVWRMGDRSKRYRWDMAILVNPEEKVPPSDKDAISRFKKAAGKLGINAVVASAGELQNISHYDALFIRETTAIDHHTYRLARKAEASGLVVIDDPTSILRCCNKVYLHDAFNYQGVPSLATEVVTDCNEATLDQLEQKFNYPIVLKMPEGSFSRGVFKVNSRVELAQQLRSLLQDTALVLVQEYLFTEYDWRIGILSGRALYACRYFMARNHWQIYNHESKRFFSGGFETLPTFEAPKAVLTAALKAAKAVGNGLYGVDLKFRDGQAYVLEVNDNPSIDHEVEDGYLGNELYMQIMLEFLHRLEHRGR